MIRFNARILKIERPGAVDRYGPVNAPVFESLKCRLVDKTRFTKSIDGDELMIDATVWLDALHRPKVKDVITMDNADRDVYEVQNVDDEQDVAGATQFFVCNCTKQG